jgi:hypothetical protein
MILRWRTPIKTLFQFVTNQTCGWILFCGHLRIHLNVIFQLYHGENKLIFNEMMRFVLYYTNTLSWIFYSASSLKQQSTDRHEEVLMILRWRTPIKTLFQFVTNQTCGWILFCGHLRIHLNVKETSHLKVVKRFHNSTEKSSSHHILYIGYRVVNGCFLAGIHKSYSKIVQYIGYSVLYWN